MPPHARRWHFMLLDRDLCVRGSVQRVACCYWFAPPVNSLPPVNYVFGELFKNISTLKEYDHSRSVTSRRRVSFKKQFIYAVMTVSKLRFYAEKCFLCVVYYSSTRTWYLIKSWHLEENNNNRLGRSLHWETSRAVSVHWLSSIS